MTNNGQFTFERATKKKAKLRMLISGPSGSGKTMSSLKIARGIADRIALIDTEHASASKYADQFQFDTLNLDDATMTTVVQAIEAAEAADYELIILDSASHVWLSALEEVDKITRASRSGNSYVAWGEVTPKWNRVLRKIVACRAHVIATSRSKTEYVLQEDSRGRKVPKKVGMAPMLRDMAEYEFDVFAEMDLDNNFVVSKTRCSELKDEIIEKPDEALGKRLLAWLDQGEEDYVGQLRDVLKTQVGCRDSGDYDAVVRRCTGDKHTASECRRQDVAKAVLMSLNQLHASGTPYKQILEGCKQAEK